ncbi:hypothetical protein HPP92_016716 [Vanilla planifolia]|uniref:Uncharacterized protein n=1 Tax=Vanilla planifolia TaxID=51239 RepID=A0A835QKP2_VANPL|nr:hypothetical protein HPP92_016716 [Vanilla planifolia]
MPEGWRIMPPSEDSRSVSSFSIDEACLPPSSRASHGQHSGPLRTSPGGPLGSLCQDLLLPGLGGSCGDFNVTLHSVDVSRTARFSRSAADDFQQLIDCTGLLIPPVSGSNFTWQGKRNGKSHPQLLDYFLCNSLAGPLGRAHRHPHGNSLGPCPILFQRLGVRGMVVGVASSAMCG